MNKKYNNIKRCLVCNLKPKRENQENLQRIFYNGVDDMPSPTPEPVSKWRVGSVHSFLNPSPNQMPICSNAKTTGPNTFFSRDPAIYGDPYPSVYTASDSVALVSTNSLNYRQGAVGSAEEGYHWYSDQTIVDTPTFTLTEKFLTMWCEVYSLDDLADLFEEEEIEE